MEERMAILEEYVRASLSIETLTLNSQAAKGWPDYNERALRLQEAYRKLPDDLFDEVYKESMELFGR